MTGKRGRRGNRQGGVRFVRGRWRVRYSDAQGVQREKVIAAASKREALQALNDVLLEVEAIKGRAPVRTMAELYQACRREKLALESSVADIDQRWANLSPFFAPLDVNGITSTLLAEYVERRALDVEKSTINRELATVKQLLRFGAQSTPPLVRWDAIPRIKLADESDRVRTVFVEDDTWGKIFEHLAPHLRPMFTVAYWLGWRRGELIRLLRSQVDLKRGTVRLLPGRTKNKDGRLVYLPAEALQALRDWDRVTRALERKKGIVIPWVFHWRGARIESYYKGWTAALRRAGFEKGAYTPHDFRRTAARSYIRAGVPDVIVMRITGHKTRNMLDRYNITSDPDLEAAAKRIATHKSKSRKGLARSEGGK